MTVFLAIPSQTEKPKKCRHKVTWKVNLKNYF